MRAPATATIRHRTGVKSTNYFTRTQRLRVIAREKASATRRGLAAELLAEARMEARVATKARVANHARLHGG